MSWYFFGGFSAYAIVPSARLVNHSGCFVTHGWSGEHCSAKSSATSMPSSCVLGDEGVEVLDRAEVGVDRVVAALGRADRPRGADVVGPGGQGVVGALAVGGADRVDRRQVDDVEAHRRDGGQPLRGGAERAGPRTPFASGAAPSERGKNSYQAPYSARSRSTRSGSGSVRDDQLAQRVTGEGGPHLGCVGGGEPGRHGAARCRAARSPRRAAARRPGAGRDAAAARS